MLGIAGRKAIFDTPGKRKMVFVLLSAGNGVQEHLVENI